jgi:hypothetical protein
MHVVNVLRAETRLAAWAVRLERDNVSHLRKILFGVGEVMAEEVFVAAIELATPACAYV